MLVAYDIFEVSFAIANSKAELIAVDTGYAATLGYTADQALGLSAREVTHPDDRGDYLALVSKVQACQAPLIVKKRSIRKDGSLVWVQNRLSLLHSSTGLQLLIASRRVDPPLSIEPQPVLPEAQPCARYVEDMAHQLGRMCSGVQLDLTADLLSAASLIAPREADIVARCPHDVN